jgi:hypothetical protein
MLFDVCRGSKCMIEVVCVNEEINGMFPIISRTPDDAFEVKLWDAARHGSSIPFVVSDELFAIVHTSAALTSSFAKITSRSLRR